MIKDYASMDREELVSELVAVRGRIAGLVPVFDVVDIDQVGSYMDRLTALEMRAGVIALAIFDLSESS
jgi:hypothetical protein